MTPNGTMKDSDIIGLKGRGEIKFHTYIYITKIVFLEAGEKHSTDSNIMKCSFLFTSGKLQHRDVHT
jgi:hypothetical protein